MMCEKISLRKLLPKDHPFMKEWMKMPETSKYFKEDFKSLDDQQILNFISNSISEKNIHFAIVNEDDEYLGTISLKNIDKVNKNAEYAIVLREKFRGRGHANEATELILKYAFEELDLQKVYLNVLDSNTRAIEFYEEFGFSYEGEFKKHILHNGIFKNLKWYAISKEK